MIDNRYKDYFIPLIQDFIRGVEPLAHPDINGMPEPFLPLFGENYETSAVRLVFIGQDTRGWGDLKQFITAEKAIPGCKLDEGLAEFRTAYDSDASFTHWGKTRQQFLGFTMMMLAALHGKEDWQVMKHGKMVEILNSFAWANANAIELYRSLSKRLSVPKEYWDAVRRAGEPFNRFRHIMATLKPHAAIILYRGLNPKSYFEGYEPKVVYENARLTHYHLPEIEVDVYHAPHPQSMNRMEGTDHFLKQIKDLLLRHNTVLFPTFLADQEEGGQVMEYLQRKSPMICTNFNKFEFISWVAEELAKRGTFMSVPALVKLINMKGGKANNGDTFSGGRGSYRLVRATYYRMIAAKRPDKAKNVAVAFRRPSFEYAYQTE